MALHPDDEADQERVWAAWLDTRPARVRDVASRFKPWRAHRFKDTGRPCFIHSFNEATDGTVTLKVVAPQWFGPDHMVFGVDPNNVEEVP